jgi:hypothetical protein
MALLVSKKTTAMSLPIGGKNLSTQNPSFSSLLTYPSISTLEAKDQTVAMHEEAAGRMRLWTLLSPTEAITISGWSVNVN